MGWGCVCELHLKLNSRPLIGPDGLFVLEPSKVSSGHQMNSVITRLRPETMDLLPPHLPLM